MLFTNEYKFLNTLFWVVFSGLLAYLVKTCYGILRKITKVYKFNGPQDSSLLIGQTEMLSSKTDLHHYLRSLARDYFPHYRLRIAYSVSVNILSPEDCEIIMATKQHSSKSEIYSLLSNWLRDGLLLTTGEKWVQRRKILTPAFHFSILKDFLSIFNEKTEHLLKIISRECSEPIDVAPLGSEFSLYTINETAMGHNLDPNDKYQKEYRDAIYQIERILKYKLMRPWLLIPWIYFFSNYHKMEMRLIKILHNFTQRIIRERMNTFKGLPVLEGHAENEDDIYTGKKKRFAMLDVLLQANQNGQQIDYEGICEEVDTFMFEGHDTTAVSISFTLMLIANHCDIQEQIYQEVRSVLGEKITKPTYNDLQKMDLLERCIKESLRLYPSVHFISRVCDEDTVLHSGLVVPKDALIHIHIFDIHRNPNIYPDPEKFDPDRFLPDNSQNRHPFAYIPFSAGPRNCIGQRFAMLEIKALLTGILQRFKLIAVDTPDTISIRNELVLRTKDGIKVQFSPRN